MRLTFKSLQDRVEAVGHGFMFERSGRTYRDAHKYELCSNEPQHIGTTGCYDTLLEALQDIQLLEGGKSPFDNRKRLDWVRPTKAERNSLMEILSSAPKA